MKARLGGRTTWYPVTLDRVQANHHYRVDLTISNYGMDHPEDLLSAYGRIAATVSVAAWTEGSDFVGEF